MPQTSITNIDKNSVNFYSTNNILTHPTEESVIKSDNVKISSEARQLLDHVIEQSASLPQSSTTTYVGDIAQHAYVREQKIEFASYGLRPNRRVYPYFDGKDVTNIIQAPNIVELNNSNIYIGLAPIAIKNITESVDPNNPKITKQINLQRNRVYFGSGDDVFADVYFSERMPNGNTRIYISDIKHNPSRASLVAGTYSTPVITPGMTVRTTRNGATVTSTVVSYSHRSGVAGFSSGTGSNFIIGSDIAGYGDLESLTYGSNNTSFGRKIIKLSDDASSIDNYYTGNTLTIVNGLNPGVTSNIISYTGSTRTAILDNPLGGISLQGNKEYYYTIGDRRAPGSQNPGNNSIFTSEKGYVAGTIHLPAPSVTPDYRFRTGDKLIKITDSPNALSEDATTISEYIYNTFGLSLGKGQLTINYFSDQAPTSLGSVPSQDINGVSTPIPPPVSVGGEIVLTDELISSDNPPVKSDKINPLAQTFSVPVSEYPQGIFVPYIDLFFQTKGTTGIEIHIRPVVNGYPDVRNIIPGSTAFVDADDVNISNAPNASDANTYTRFTFNSPVYLLPDTEYCIVISSSDPDYSIYVAEIGERVIGSNRTVSQQPYSGSLFKSQNSSVYTPILSEDLMFVIHKCEFISQGLIRFHERKDADMNNAIFKNYYDPNTAFDSFEVHSTYTKPSLTSATFSYKAKSNTTLAMDSDFNQFLPDKRVLIDNRKIVFGPTINEESFIMNVDLATSSRDVSPVIYINQQKLRTGTTIINDMPLKSYLFNVANTGNGYTYSNTSVTITGNNRIAANGVIATIFETPFNGRIAHVLLDNLGAGYYDDASVSITSANGINANVMVTTETSPSGGPAVARYISKVVTLAPGFDAGDLRVYLTAIKPIESEIAVYYKVKNQYDDDSIDNKNWVRMQRKEGIVNYSDGFTPIELEYAPSFTSNNIVYSSSTATFDTFNQFKIKIVLGSSSTSLEKIPYVYDMRAVALPADVE